MKIYIFTHIYRDGKSNENSRVTFLAKKNWHQKMAEKWPKIAQKLPKIDKRALKLPEMAQKLAPAKKNSRDISPVSPTFCISG